MHKMMRTLNHHRRFFGSNSKLLLFFRQYVSTCRAVLLPRFGGPEVLQLHANTQVPDLKPNEVLVRAHAVSINPLDTRVSSTDFALFSISWVCLIWVCF